MSLTAIFASSSEVCPVLLLEINPGQYAYQERLSPVGGRSDTSITFPLIETATFCFLRGFGFLGTFLTPIQNL
jgi:hypothetical protein